jgi:hypothetical protein
MPTLVRFFIVVLVLAGLVGAAMIYLANFVEPNTREMTVRIPPSRLEPTPIARPAPPPEAAADDTTATPAAATPPAGEPEAVETAPE